MFLGYTVGLADYYYRPKKSELVEEYMKAIPDFTVLEAKDTVSPEEIQSFNDFETERRVLFFNLFLNLFSFEM
jgi:hypothetical protein